MNLNQPVWKMNKREAGAMLVTEGALGVACLFDASLLWPVALFFFFAAALFGWRLYYIFSRDTKAAQVSRVQVAEQYDAPRMQQPQNRLYVPKDHQRG